jgi:hypothetical protein
VRIGSIPFVDGLTHDVYEDDGRQWVAAYDGEGV